MSSYAKFIPNKIKTSVLKITSYDRRVMKGTLSNPYYPEEMPFYGIVQLVSLVDAIQEGTRYPEHGVEMRRFGPAGIPADVRAGAPEESEKTELSRKKAIATFHISVFFRQNASWQGSIHWEEQDSMANFRSVLELIWLMDSALMQ